LFRADARFTRPAQAHVIARLRRYSAVDAHSHGGMITLKAITLLHERRRLVALH
jgi:hypothetical protein